MKRGLALLLLLALACSGCRETPQTGYAYIERRTPPPMQEEPAQGASFTWLDPSDAAQKTYLYEWDLLLAEAPKKYAFQWGSFTETDIKQLMALIRLREWESMDRLFSAFEGGIWPDIAEADYGADAELWVSFLQFEQAGAAVLCVQEGGGQTLLLMFTMQGENYVPYCALGGIRDFASCRVELVGGEDWIIYESVAFRRDKYTTWYNTGTGQCELSYYTDVSGNTQTKANGGGQYQISAGEPEITGREHADFSVSVPVRVTFSDWEDVSFEKTFNVLLHRDERARDFYVDAAPEDYVLNGTLRAKRHFLKELRSLLKTGNEREKAWALGILQEPIAPAQRRPYIHKPAVLYPLTYLSAEQRRLKEYAVFSNYRDGGIAQWQIFELCEAINQARKGTLREVLDMFEEPIRRGDGEDVLRFDRVSGVQAVYYGDAMDIRYRERGTDKGLLLLFTGMKNGNYALYKTFSYTYNPAGGRFPVLEDGIFTIPVEQIGGLYAWQSTLLTAPERSWVSLLQDIPEQDDSHIPRVRVEVSFLPVDALERDYSRDGTLRVTVEFPAIFSKTQTEFPIWEAQMQDEYSDILLSGRALLHRGLREEMLARLKVEMEGEGLRGRRAKKLFEDVNSGKLGGRESSHSGDGE